MAEYWIANDTNAMSIDAAFGFKTPQENALAAIDSTKYPDTNKDFQQNLIRLNQFVDYIASYLQQMQKGIDQNSQDPIAQIQGLASDLVVLLGGGELLYGIDLGDLQYFLPAIGALLGFDQTTPFPINLFNAAEHFLLGYVVPLDSFGTVIEGIIDGWALALGIDQDWINAINDVLDAIDSLTSSFQDLLTSIENMFQIIGPINQLFADLWHVLSILLGGFDLSSLGNITDSIFKSVAPWIEELAQGIEWLNQIIESWAQGLNDISGILNFSWLFTPFLNFLEGFIPATTKDGKTTLVWDYLTGWETLILNAILPHNYIAPLISDASGSAGLTGFVPLENLAMELMQEFFGEIQPVIDTIVNTLLVLTGSDWGIPDLERSLQSIPAQNLVGTIPQTLNSHVTIGSLSPIIPEFLTNGNFDSPNALVGQGIWIWDGTQGPPGTTTSVYANANGHLIELLSNAIAVAPGMILSVSGMSRWANLVGSGPISLTIAKFDINNNIIGYDTIASIIGASATQSTWQQLINTSYTVPSSVTSICVRPTIDAGFTSGQVWFGELSCKQTLTSILVSLIPLLDASKIGSGILGVANTPNITLAMSSDLQGITDYITNTLNGALSFISGNSTSTANNILSSFYDKVVTNALEIAALKNNQQATDYSSNSINIDFSTYPDGPLPPIFTVSYTGSGSSSIGIKNGVAGWQTVVNDGTRRARIIYNDSPTVTDFQRISGGMNSAPSQATSGGQPYFYAIGRVDNPTNPQNYVWARAYCTGFLTYKADIGYCVGGVETPLWTGINLNWSLQMTFVVGANGNPRHYQLFSGTNLVYENTEPGTASQYGPGFRYWGAMNTITYDASFNTPGQGGAVAGVSVVDNSPPLVSGSTFRVYRASTVAVATAGATTSPMGAFFDTDTGAGASPMGWCSSDLTWDGTNLGFSIEGTYGVHIRYLTPSVGAGYGSAAIYKTPNGASQFLHSRIGSYFSDGATGAYARAIEGYGKVYCKSGDKITPGFDVGGITSFTGESTGTQCYMEVALLNRSTA